MEEMVRFSVSLPASTQRKLKVISILKKKNMSVVVAKLILGYVKRHEGIISKSEVMANG